jgi:methionyl-tRNA formyltransferase
MYMIFATTQKVLELWDKGQLVRSEFLFRLLQTVNTQNLNEFLTHISKDILKEVLEEVSTAPKTNEKWKGMRITRSWNGPWNEEIAARVRKEDEEAIQRYREGVEALRAYFATMV